MKCNVCGAEIDEGTVTCPYCGCAPEGDGRKKTVYSSTEAGNADAGSSNSASFSEGYKGVSEPAVGLKWANFLGYFLLWIGALANVATAYEVFSGGHYNKGFTTAELVYEFYGNGLKYADKFYGACLLFAALLGVITAMAILKFKSSAIKLVPAIYLYNAIVVTVYCALVSGITGVNYFSPAQIVAIIMGVIMVCINVVYFNKRKHIFVN